MRVLYHQELWLPQVLFDKESAIFCRAELERPSRNGKPQQSRTKNPPRRHGVAEPEPNPKPTTEARRHGEKPEKTSCTAEARRRGEEFDFDENLRKKRGNLGLVIRRHGEDLLPRIHANERE